MRIDKFFVEFVSEIFRKQMSTLIIISNNLIRESNPSRG